MRWSPLAVSELVLQTDDAGMHNISVNSDCAQEPLQHSPNLKRSHYKLIKTTPISHKNSFKNMIFFFPQENK